MAKACRTYLNAFDNLDYDAETNGELALVDRLGFAAGSTVFDVGANVGLWTAAVRSRFPLCAVHAIEIDPVVAGPLSVRFGGVAKVTVAAQGLSVVAGAVVLRRRGRSSTATSIINASEMNRDAETIDVRVVTGDEYLEASGVERLAFVKVDTEGNDMNVVRGFSAALGAGRIDALQFEHNSGRSPLTSTHSTSTICSHRLATRSVAYSRIVCSSGHGERPMSARRRATTSSCAATFQSDASVSRAPRVHHADCPGSRPRRVPDAPGAVDPCLAVGVRRRVTCQPGR